jgi:hypothetical protein
MRLTIRRALAVLVLGLCAAEASAKCHVSWVDDDANPTTPPMPQQVCDNAAAVEMNVVADTTPVPAIPALPPTAVTRSCSQVFDSSVGADATVCSARVEASVNWQ